MSRDTAIIATPIGSIRITGDAEAIDAIRIEPAQPAQTASLAPVRAAAAQLAEYFAGTRTAFDLPLAPAGTARGNELRAAMVAIPFGETESYGAFARRAGSSPRAIGQVCARNPFPIVVPCHRVLGAGDALGHYSAGDGAATKRWLLDHEAASLRKA